jgi:hypothetical protein
MAARRRMPTMRLYPPHLPPATHVNQSSCEGPISHEGPLLRTPTSSRSRAYECPFSIVHPSPRTGTIPLPLPFESSYLPLRGTHGAHWKVLVRTHRASSTHPFPLDHAPTRASPRSFDPSLASARPHSHSPSSLHTCVLEPPIAHAGRHSHAPMKPLSPCLEASCAHLRALSGARTVPRMRAHEPRAPRIETTFTRDQSLVCPHSKALT